MALTQLKQTCPGAVPGLSSGTAERICVRYSMRPRTRRDGELKRYCFSPLDAFVNGSFHPVGWEAPSSRKSAETLFGGFAVFHRIKHRLRDIPVIDSRSSSHVTKLTRVRPVAYDAARVSGDPVGLPFA